jgi:hypothetical protein
MLMSLTTLAACDEPTPEDPREDPPKEEPTVEPPPDEVIVGVEFDWDTHERRAPGSDNWAITWAADDLQYTVWGDGGGFGGTNDVGRVSLGVATVAGGWQDYEGSNVYGGVGDGADSEIDGKSRGILALGDTLYMWVTPESGPAGFRGMRLYRSGDRGRSWIRSDWWFHEEGFSYGTFLQAGRDHAQARDEYVYSYVTERQDTTDLTLQAPGLLSLLRAPADRLAEREAWQFFVGLDAESEPVWSPRPEDRTPVYSATDGVGWASGAVYVRGLDRYLITTEHGESSASNLHLLEGAEPWGPWRTVLREEGWGSDHVERSIFHWFFAPAWFSDDGLEFTLVFSGRDENDSWNTIRGRFTLGPDPGDGGG